MVRMTVSAAASMVLLLTVEPAFAQVFQGCSSSFSSYSQNRVDQRYSVRNSILSQSTVSPYLALTNLGGSSQSDTSFNYFTQVRPRLESQQQQRSQQRSIANLQRQVGTMQTASGGRNQQGVRITGHPTRFNTYLHYYPQFRR